MKKAILFRYHKEFDVCQNHIQLFRKYNPGVKIYGMYGGPEKDWPLTKVLSLDHNWNIPISNAYYKWKNGDLCQAMWHKKIGHTFDFDIIYGFGWDSLLLAPLSSYYPELKETLFLKNVHPLNADTTGLAFVTGPGRKEWDKLLALMKSKYGYASEPIHCQFLGAGVPRSFWERYSKETIPEYCNDELRVALFAQAWNYPIYDTGALSKRCKVGRVSLSKQDIVDGYALGEILFNPVHIKISTPDLKFNKRR